MKEMGLRSHLRPLALGRITAKGWLREQLMRMKDGLGGHLDELEPNMIANPYVNGQTNEEWGSSIKAGWGAEISGNYWYGLIQLAYTLGDESLQAKAGRWVDAVLKNRRPDGYLGTYGDTDNKMDDYNAWGTQCGLNALLAYYDATGRADVLAAVHDCLLWFCEHWSGDRKTRYGGVAITISMAQVYLFTGDERLRRFIDEYWDFLARKDLYLNSIPAMLKPNLTYNSNHAAAYAQLPKYAAFSYLATGEETYLRAAINAADKVIRRAVLPTGGIASNTEYLSPITMNTETEYCTYSFFHNTLVYLSAVTGSGRYLDTAERIALNGAQGARKKDEKAIAYFTSPNQIYATDHSDLYGGDMQVYAPCYPTSCCPVTSVWAMPDYVYSLGMTDAAGHPHITGYAPARLDFGSILLDGDTNYPFEDTVRYVVHCEKPIRETLFFRVPGWCEGAQIAVDGVWLDAVPDEDGYAAVSQEFADGMDITVRLPMRVSIRRIDDSDGWRHEPLAVEYGPLVFALPIPEIWRVIPGSPRTPLPEGWHWYNVEPEIIPDPNGDVYEQIGLTKYRISWNVALDETLDPDTVQVEKRDGGYVWENPPLTLTLPGYKALFSYAPYIRRTHEVYQAPIDVQEPLTLTLIPYGCTALRISCFPRAKLES